MSRNINYRTDGHRTHGGIVSCSLDTDIIAPELMVAASPTSSSVVEWHASRVRLTIEQGINIPIELMQPYDR